MRRPQIPAVDLPFPSQDQEWVAGGRCLCTTNGTGRPLHAPEMRRVATRQICVE